MRKSYSAEALCRYCDSRRQNIEKSQNLCYITASKCHHLRRDLSRLVDYLLIEAIKFI